MDLNVEGLKAACLYMVKNHNTAEDCKINLSEKFYQQIGKYQ